MQKSLFIFKYYIKLVLIFLFLFIIAYFFFMTVFGPVINIKSYFIPDLSFQSAVM